MDNQFCNNAYTYDAIMGTNYCLPGDKGWVKISQNYWGILFFPVVFICFLCTAIWGSPNLTGNARQFCGILWGGRRRTGSVLFNLISLNLF